MWIINAIRHNERGNVAVPFALLAPMLVLLSLGTVEIATLMFEWHRTNEATRWAVRHAAIEQPVPNLSTFDRGSVVTCQGSTASGVSCSGGSLQNAALWDEIVNEMQARQPLLQPNNIKLTYQDSGLGDPTTPGGIIPMVSIELVGVSKPLMVMGGYMGMPTNFTFPAFRSYQMANSIGPTQ